MSLVRPRHHYEYRPPVGRPGSLAAEDSITSARSEKSSQFLYSAIDGCDMTRKRAASPRDEEAAEEAVGTRNLAAVGRRPALWVRALAVGGFWGSFARLPATRSASAGSFRRSRAAG
jgi:hypothetical protein